MTAKRAAAYIGFVTLAAAWLSSAAGMTFRSPAQREQPSPTPTAGTETLAADVQAQAGRLRERMSSAPIPQEPLRNPFAFVPRDAPPQRAATPAPVSATAAPPPAAPDPPLELIGIAEDHSPKGIVRTAMIMDGDTLFMLKEGEAFVGRYRVSAIGADAVELTDLTTNAVRRLGLR